jgi:DNA-binding protein
MCPHSCHSAVNQSIERARPTIFVGSKPAIAYVVASLMELSKGREVTIKARGKAISKAVDAVQVIRTRYLSGSLRIRKISFDSEARLSPDGNAEDRLVSCIEIVIATGHSRT